jgi:hypothetical protein
MVSKTGGELEPARRGSTTNKSNVCLAMWKELAMPTVYHQNGLSAASCHRKRPLLAATVGPATASLPGRQCVRGISFSSAPFTMILLLFIATSKDLCVKQKIHFNKDRSQLINIMASVLFGTLSFVGIHMGEVQTRTF